MKKILIIIVTLVLSSCATKKQVDDTEHKWIGGNGIEFYE